MSEWFNPSDKLPPLGKVVLVKCVVRYGRKRRFMAAKLIDSAYIHSRKYLREDWSWIALQDDCAYTTTIELKEVLHWRFFPRVEQDFNEREAA